MVNLCKNDLFKLSRTQKEGPYPIFSNQICNQGANLFENLYGNFLFIHHEVEVGI